jgi:sarcosine oxidase subunit beta
MTQGLPKTADVVVIGGGIVGASIAYHLTARGCRDVLIVERECVQGLGSTGRATGGVRAQFSHALDIQMSLHSIEFFKNFRESIGVDPAYCPNGYLFLATEPSQVSSLRELVALQHRAGLKEVRWMSRREIAAKAPFLFTDDVLGGSYCSLDGFIEPLNLLQGFMQKAVEQGARLHLETEVTGLHIQKGQIVGVETNRGTIATRQVVNAAGAWAKRVAAFAGIELPVEPLRRHVAGTQPFSALPDEAPMVIELATSFHFRKDQQSGGVMLLWNDPEEPYGENLSFSTLWLKKLLDLARRRVPIFSELQISPKRSWTGLYEVTPDRHPILGQAPTVKGFYLANGFSGHGVMHSPATGRLLAELITEGRAKTLDITPLALERFSSGRLIPETGVL